METALAVQDDQLTLGHLSATICAELAAGLADADGIMAKYEISQAQWQKLKSAPAFRNMLKDALRKFQGDIGAPARIKMKAEILLEDSLPVLDGIIHDKEGAVGNKIDSVKQLAILAEKTGNKSNERGGASGTGFSVNIHINTGEGQEAEPVMVIEQPPED